MTNHNKQRGVVALSTILLLSGVIVEIGIAGALIVYALSNANYAARLSSESLAAAKAGLEDAMIRLARNKDLSANPFYSLAVGRASVEVTICNDLKTIVSTCDTANTGYVEITALGKTFNKRRKLQSIISVNDITGEIRVVSLKEVAV